MYISFQKQSSFCLWRSSRKWTFDQGYIWTVIDYCTLTSPVLNPTSFQPETALLFISVSQKPIHSFQTLQSRTLFAFYKVSQSPQGSFLVLNSIPRAVAMVEHWFGPSPLCSIIYLLVLNRHLFRFHCICCLVPVSWINNRNVCVYVHLLESHSIAIHSYSTLQLLSPSQGPMFSFESFQFV